jgi:hypothetical protein
MSFNRVAEAMSICRMTAVDGVGKLRLFGE